MSHIQPKFDPTQSLKPRLGVGYEDPDSELFADGTPSTRRPIRDAHSTELVTLMTSGKIRNNPPAGEVRRIELTGEWMEFWNDRVETETEKARVVLYEKRIFGLAKQTAAGLAKIGIKYEMTSLANIIRMALIVKRDGMPVKGSINDKRRGEMERSVGVMGAIVAYDLVKVAELLDVMSARPKTFGNDATKR